MCGIFGWQFRPNFRPNLAKRMMLAHALGQENLSRGKDSWGWFSLDTGEIVKGLGEITGNTATMAASFSAFGHTRHATVGKVDHDNAHPFHIGDVIGAHNGGIGNHKDLNDLRKAVNLQELTCDSMHLIDAIDAGLTECENLVGWGAVEWVQLYRPRTVRLAKLPRGDLSALQCQEGIIWSSSKYDLVRAARTCGFRGIVLELDEGPVYDIHNGVIRISSDVIKLATSGPMGFFQQGQTTGSQSAMVFGGQSREALDSARKKKALGKKDPRPTPPAIETKVYGAGDRLCYLCVEKLNDIGVCPNGHVRSPIDGVV